MVKEAKKSKKPPKHYSAEQWATIRTLFESGSFSSLSNLYNHCTKLFNPCPSLQSMKLKAANDNWCKTALKEAIEEKKAESFKDMFSELGLSERKMAEVLVSGVLSAEKTRDEIIKGLIDKGSIPTDPIELAMMQSSLSSLFSEMRTAHKYIETCLRLTGANPSEKKSLTVRGVDENGLRMARSFEEMSDEELDKELNRLQTIKDGR